MLLIISCGDNSNGHLKKETNGKCLLNVIDEQCSESFDSETIRLRKFDNKSRDLILLRVENTKNKFNAVLKLIPQHELNPFLEDARVSYSAYKVHFSSEDWSRLYSLIESLPCKESGDIFLMNNGYFIEVYKNEICKRISIDMNDSNSLLLKAYTMKIDSILSLAQEKTRR